MPNTPQRILPLSAEAIAQIHSSKHITSLTGVVLALLENALDAGASRIEISVDWRRGGCTVDDNGVGIPSAEFHEDGSLGKLYCTSKRPSEGARPKDIHGSTGTFLAELAAMSLLSISATHTQSQTRENVATLTLHHGKVIARRLPDPSPGLATSRQQNGTTVTVRDLFGNMPVRIKQRALAGEASSEDDKCWHELKRGVVALLLAWPKPCSVKLRDTNAESRSVTIPGTHPSAPTTLTTKSLEQLAGKTAKSDLRDALPILFQSGFALPTSRSKWVPLSASTSAISLKGLICLDPAPTKQCQFIALGITPCSTNSGHNELYDAVTKVFSNSSFGILEESAGVATDANNEIKAANEPVFKQLQAKKGVDRFPTYYIQLKFIDRSHRPASELEGMSDSSLKAVVGILEAAVSTWLESNHFRPRKGRTRRNEKQESPAGLLRPSLSHFDDTNNRNQIRQFDSTTTTPQRNKRRKVIDLSDRPASRGMEWKPDLAADAEELSTMSRMRFGRSQSALPRPISHPDVVEVQRAKSSSSARPKNMSLGMTVTKRRTLQAATIEAEELGGIGTGRKSRSGFGTLESPQTPNDDSGRSPAGNGESQRRIPSSDDFGSVDEAELLSAEQVGCWTQPERHSGEGDEIDDNITWQDPVSKQIFRVNSRTGVVLPMPEESSLNGTAPTRQRAAIDTALSSKGKPLSLARRSAIAKKESAERPATADADKWLPGFLEQWSNPVFARQKEEPIPAASRNGPGLLEFDGNGNCCSHEHFDARMHNDSAGTKLTKTALKEADVIAQVDNKFILCKMPAAASQQGHKGTLVLIDQHAASERVMLENLLEELCAPSNDDSTSIQSTSLRNGTARAQPLVLEISAKEVDLFNRYRAHFARWGVLYDLPRSDRPDSGPEQKQPRIRVTHLPTPVAERCANFPALAIDMLRSEIWALEDGSRKVGTDVRISAEEQNREQPLWLSLLSAIPPSLLALLHSRSCRSAIMFNDVLSQEQCVELVGKLGKCVFPFVCAHGRVSMVPLRDIGHASIDSGGASCGRDQEAMGAWLRSRGDAAEDVEVGDSNEDS